jgi:hypothetical protein
MKKGGMAILILDKEECIAKKIIRKKGKYTVCATDNRNAKYVKENLRKLTTTTTKRQSTMLLEDFNNLFSIFNTTTQKTTMTEMLKHIIRKLELL